ncbi:hypothetical protein ABPG72_012265 [Tetrahymena utriculariae]
MYNKWPENKNQFLFENKTGPNILHNASKTHTYTKGINQFTDLTQEEFVVNYLNPVLSQTDKLRFLQNDGGKEGGKDGGQNCTSPKGYDIPPPPVIQHFCQGGWPSSAYNYIKSQGISSQQSYPYIGANRNYSIKSASPPKAFDAKDYIYYWTNNGNQTNLVQYEVNQGPISVLVDASNWSSYSQGVFNNCGNVTINHAVLLVGYDQSGSKRLYYSSSWQYMQRIQSLPLGGL